ncbi:MAG: GlsB/YeaQ/YmgE family stress response membrane protein [Paracoccus sp. (in: a-proteobacteria)]|nr:GlsB/YeaQ/YmgE family stress response membrane protein [Paracoccus sp. (in: a-proteobacteria)]
MFRIILLSQEDQDKRMGQFGIIAIIIIGGLAGWISSRIMGTGTGIVMNIILGIIGAAFGNWLVRTLVDGAPTGAISQIIVAVIGSCILIWGSRAIWGRN